jgi:hypothetical protein
MPPLPANAITERSFRPQHLHHHSVADFYEKTLLVFVCLPARRPADAGLVAGNLRGYSVCKVRRKLLHADEDVENSRPFLFI